jgi:hypothetical protein
LAAIAARRTSGARHAMEREANTVVNTVVDVLLEEREPFNGVVSFAANRAANFDAACGARWTGSRSAALKRSRSAAPRGR